MARIDTPADPLSDLAFEVERFMWTSDDRLEVSGRWFGVRGRRFMRPTLHLRVDGRRRRLIAVLDHKPWAADTEGAWTAAFTWRGEHGGITTPRLEVSPDLVLDLPPPGEAAAGATLTPRPRPKREPRKPPTPRRDPPAATDAEPRKRKPPATPPPTAAEPEPATAEAAASPTPAALPESATAEPAGPPAATAPPKPEPEAAAEPPAESTSSAEAWPLPEFEPPAAAPRKTPPPRAAAAPEKVAPESPPDDLVEPKVPMTPLDPGPLEAAAEEEVEPAAQDEPVAAPAPTTPFDPGPAPARSGVAADIHLLALERRLVEERAERERIGEDLADAQVRIEALSTHQASAVERANDVVRLEGELAAALVRAESAERRAANLERQLKGAQRQGVEAEQLKSRLEDVKEDLAEARAPLDVDPLPSRVARRRRSLSQEDSSTRLVAAGVVVILLVLFVLVLATVL